MSFVFESSVTDFSFFLCNFLFFLELILAFFIRKLHGLFFFNHISWWLSLPTLQQPLRAVFPWRQAHQVALSSIFLHPFFWDPSSHLIYSGSLLLRPEISDCGRAGMGPGGERGPRSVCRDCRQCFQSLTAPAPCRFGEDMCCHVPGRVLSFCNMF